jgi:hypothetical protein
LRLLHTIAHHAPANTIPDCTMLRKEGRGHVPRGRQGPLSGFCRLWDFCTTCCVSPLVLNDHGCGFDPDAEYPGHLGLRSMRERAARIGAEFAIASVPGDTRVRLLYRPGDDLSRPLWSLSAPLHFFTGALAHR